MDQWRNLFTKYYDTATEEFGWVQRAASSFRPAAD
jgi:hypothetical protein